MVPELNEQNLIEVLLNQAQRDALLAAIETAQDSGLAGWYDWLSARCDATPEQLRAVMSFSRRTKPIGWCVTISLPQRS